MTSGRIPLWEAPIGTGNKFSRPDASSGHVYVGNREGDIFGYSGPALTPSTTSLDLGTASLGGQLTREVTFTNTGTKLKVSAVNSPSAPFEATGLPAVGTIIEPGQVITVKVAFQSSASGGFTGSLGLTTEAGETNIGLSGSAGELPPTVKTKAASPITQTSATLNATVNPNGSEVTECKLEYGTTASYGSSASCTPSPGSGTSAVAVSAAVTGLIPNTTYHFRISATNSGGTSNGSDETLMTLPDAPQEGLGILGTLPAQLPGQGTLAFQEHKAPVPDAELASRSLRVSPSGAVSVEVACPTAESRCTGTVTLRTLNASAARGRSKKRKPAILILAVGSFSVTGGKVTTVRLHLTAAARALLARKHLLRARATIIAHDSTGATHTSQTSVTIRTAKATPGRKR